MLSYITLPLLVTYCYLHMTKYIKCAISYRIKELAMKNACIIFTNTGIQYCLGNK